MSDAMGQSRLERFYAFVETKDGDLGEQLVRSGLARSYGFKSAPPGLTSSRIELRKLQQLEDAAKRDKIGGWGVTEGRLNGDAQTPSALSSFVADGNTRPPSVFVESSGAFLPVTNSPATPLRTPVAATESHAKQNVPLGNIDINTATEKELMSVPGIGYVIASRIIAAKPFRSADDLRRVTGIGDKKYEQIRRYFQ
jgi:DNA uptake protein ComE-like DNA-binding protein